MKLETKDTGERPAGKPGFCFYCDQPTSEPHGPKCVFPSKSIVVRMTIEYVVEVPEWWGEREIGFHRNEGSSCSSNDIRRLATATEGMNDGKPCACAGPGAAEFAFVREATEEDHETMIVCIEEEG